MNNIIGQQRQLTYKKYEKTVIVSTRTMRMRCINLRFSEVLIRKGAWISGGVGLSTG